MFSLTRREVTGGAKGIAITFKNKYCVSIQFGPGNYCDNYDMPYENILFSIDVIRDDMNVPASFTAETAIISPSDEFIEYPEMPGNLCQSRMTPDDVLKLMNYVATLEEATEEK